MEHRWAVTRWVGAVELVRGAAALSVVLHHAAQSFGIPRLGAAGALYEWVGSWGVTLFFVLSGFCIHLPQALREQSEAPHSMQWKEFFRRRAVRLLPTHYASLALSAIVGAYATSELISRPNAVNLIAHIGMVHVWTGAFYSINAVFWSIAIEVHFYCLYPLYMRLRKAQGSLHACIGLLVLALFSYYLASQFFAGEIRFGLQHLFLVMWWQWALGAYLADTYCNPVGKFFVKPLLTWNGARYLWSILSLAIGLRDPVIAGLHIRFWLLPVCCVLLLGSIVVRPYKAGLWAPFAWLGVRSYSIYLIHPVALALIIPLLRRSCSSWPLWVLGCLAFSLLCSCTFYWAVERRFIPNRRIPGRFVSEPARMAA